MRETIKTMRYKQILLLIIIGINGLLADDIFQANIYAEGIVDQITYTHSNIIEYLLTTSLTIILSILFKWGCSRVLNEKMIKLS